MLGALAGALREAVVVRGFVVGVGDPNIIYEVARGYTATRTDEDRWRQFGSLAEHSPVLMNDLDPQLDRESEECAAFPSDPAAATSLVEDSLKYFDAHNISWTLSSFRPGRMITEYRRLSSDRKSTRLNSSHQIISYAVF